MSWDWLKIIQLCLTRSWPSTSWLPETQLMLKIIPSSLKKKKKRKGKNVIQMQPVKTDIILFIVERAWLQSLKCWMVMTTPAQPPAFWGCNFNHIFPAAVTEKAPYSRNAQGKWDPNSSETPPILLRTTDNVPTSGLSKQPADSSGNRSWFGMPITATLRK